MNTATNPAVTTATTVPGFAAFNEEKKFSFVQAYDPKTNGIEGYTMHVIRYRDTKGNASKPAKMVFLPSVNLPEYESFESGASGYFLPEKACKVLIGAIEDAQADIIRASIDAGNSLISWDDVSLEKALDFLTAARTSVRLTKEAVEAWARIALKQACHSRADEISDAKKVTDEETRAKQRDGTLARYVSEVSKLSAAVPNLGMETAQACQIMLDRAEVDDDIAKSLKKKLHAILNPSFSADDL